MTSPDALRWRPRRSVLYMPGANTRAMEKAQTLACDTVVFDLEDAVAPAAKARARTAVLQALATGHYGGRELVVRCNALDTPWGRDDLQAFADAPIHGLLLPKVERPEQVHAVCFLLDASAPSTLPLWLMIETPTAVLDARKLAMASPRVAALVLGTSDLVTGLRARHTPDRHNLTFALQQCVLAARAADVAVLDGVHLEFRDLDGLALACAQARAMGFDGKTLIHPSQIETANRSFGVTAEEVAHARAVVDAWHGAQAAGSGVAVLNGQLVENLHVAEAERTLACAQQLAEDPGA